MKKKIWIPVIAVIAVLLILFTPIPMGSYNDGGTREYVALTYKIVNWNRIHPDGVYDKTCIYFGHRSLEELWEEEYVDVEKSFSAEIIELNDNSVLVEPLEGEEERLSSDRITFGTSELESIRAYIGGKVRVYYTGQIMESYPAQIHAKSWELIDE